MMRRATVLLALALPAAAVAQDGESISETASAPETSSDTATDTASASASPESGLDPHRPPATGHRPPATGASESESSSDGSRTRLGPLALTGDAGTLRLAFAAQLRGTLDHDGEPSGAIELRRLRFWLRGRFLDDRVRLRLHLDAAPRSPELIDLWIQGNATPGFAIRVGQMKLPFSHHWDLSLTNTVFVDWPLTTRYFFGRSTGILALDPRRDSRWDWALGVYTGDASRASNGFREPTIYGERRFNRSSFSDYRGPDTPHPELVGRLRLREGPLSIAASAAWDARPVYTQDQLARFGIDGELRWGRVGLYVGGFLSLFEDRSGDPILGLGGHHTELLVTLHERVELGVRYVTIVRSNALRADARAHATQRMTEDPDTIEQYANVGELRAEHELTFAVATYAVGHDLKWQNDVTWRREAGTDRDAVQLRTQIQLAF